MLFQLSDTQTQLSVSNSQHMREIQTSQEKVSAMVDLNKFNLLNSQLVQTQQQLADLEVAMEKRASETTKLLRGNIHSSRTLSYDVSDAISIQLEGYNNVL